MAFTPAFLDELRSRVALTPIVARKVKLVRAGREMKGCCPFHNEKTPSFYVNEDKGFYHCFGCGAHGDVIRFLTDQEGLPFREAVERLAAEAGLELPRENAEDAARAKAQAGLFDVMSAAASWFTEQLHGLSGTAARDYVARRGLMAQTVADFGLGLAPDARNRLKIALADFGEDKLVECGLLIHPDDGGREAYDRFRGRLMFPIRDTRGRVVAFGGRTLGDGQPKYLNSPDTPLFDKGRMLYNLDRAAPVARKSGRLIVVEGYMDVIALTQAGIAEAVAPLGTALTEQQLHLLWRVAPEPFLCFDGDAAGQRAALRAALRALPLLEPGRSLRFITLPAGQDPDDLVRTGGAAALDALAAQAEPLIDRLWRSETEGVELQTPERRAALRERLRELGRSIQHRDVSELYQQAFRARFDALFASPPRAPFAQKNRSSGRGGRGQPFMPMQAIPRTLALSAQGSVDRTMLALMAGLIERPNLAGIHAETLAQLPQADARHARLMAALLDAVAHAPDLDKSQLNEHLGDAGLVEIADEVRRTNRLDFSFVRPQSPTDVANRDLACVVEHLMARHRIDMELDRIRSSYAVLEQEGFEMQQRLRDEKNRIDLDLMRMVQQGRED